MKIVFPDAGSGTIAVINESGLEDRLKTLGEYQCFEGIPDTADEYVRRCTGADAIILEQKLPDAVLRSVETLKIISFTGVGAANFVNIPLAKELGITVSITPGYGNDAVAEHTVALLFAAARRIVQGDSNVRAGVWDAAPGLQLTGKTAGIIGLGGIGKRVAEILHGIGMRVIAWSRSATRDNTADFIELAPVETVFAQADVVSLHLALTEQTAGFVSAALIDSMKPGSVLVNTARAQIVDTEAMLRRLKAGDLYAALDVFDREPIPTGDALLTALPPALTVTPHQGYNTPEATLNLFTMVVDNIEDYFAGKPVPQLAF